MYKIKMEKSRTKSQMSMVLIFFQVKYKYSLIISWFNLKVTPKSLNCSNLSPEIYEKVAMKWSLKFLKLNRNLCKRKILMISFQKIVCKVYLQLPVRHIIGGEPAEIREYPWMVCTLLILFGIFIYCSFDSYEHRSW